MIQSFQLSSFPVLRTGRLLLRDISPADEYALFRCLSDEEVMRFWGMPPLRSLEQAAALCENFRRGFAEGRHIRWGIVRRKDGMFLGTCGFHSWDPHNHSCEIGYEIDRMYWGNGYATEAIRAIVSFAFSYLEVYRIGALVHPDNRASERVLLNAGFQKEGMLSGYMYSEEEFHNLNMFHCRKV